MQRSRSRNDGRALADAAKHRALHAAPPQLAQKVAPCRPLRVHDHGGGALGERVGNARAERSGERGSDEAV